MTSPLFEHNMSEDVSFTTLTASNQHCGRILNDLKIMLTLVKIEMMQESSKFKGKNVFEEVDKRCLIGLNPREILCRNSMRLQISSESFRYFPIKSF